MVNVKLLKENNARCRILEVEEKERLRKELHPRVLCVYDFACYTGLRQGEMFCVTWKDVDLKGASLRVKEAKSGEGRTVPLHAIARGILDSIPCRLVGGYVFCKSHDGEAIKSIKTAFVNARERAEVEDPRFHDSRNEFTSALAMAAVDLNTIRELLGHKTMAMVMRYSHLTDRQKADAVALLDRTEDSKTDSKASSKVVGWCKLLKIKQARVAKW